MVEDKYLNKYIVLVESNKDREVTRTKTASHHIIMEAWLGGKGSGTAAQIHFDKYRVNLLHKDHVLAHWYLWKAFRDSKSATAIRLMLATNDWSGLSEKQIKEIAKDMGELTEQYATAVSDRFRLSATYEFWDSQEKEKVTMTMHELYTTFDIGSSQVHRLINPESNTLSCSNGRFWMYSTYREDMKYSQSVTGNRGAVFAWFNFYTNVPFVGTCKQLDKFEKKFSDIKGGVAKSLYRTGSNAVASRNGWALAKYCFKKYHWKHRNGIKEHCSVLTLVKKYKLKNTSWVLSVLRQVKLNSKKEVYGWSINK